MNITDEEPWLCDNCGARAYDLEGWGINPDYTLYCDRCEATPVRRDPTLLSHQLDRVNTEWATEAGEDDD